MTTSDAHSHANADLREWHARHVFQHLKQIVESTAYHAGWMHSKPGQPRPAHAERLGALFSYHAMLELGWPAYESTAIDAHMCGAEIGTEH